MSPVLWDLVIFQACHNVTVFHHTRQTNPTHIWPNAAYSSHREMWEFHCCVLLEQVCNTDIVQLSIIIGECESFWSLRAYNPAVFAFHLTSAFVWIDFGHFALNWSRKKKKLC